MQLNTKQQLDLWHGSLLLSNTWTLSTTFFICCCFEPNKLQHKGKKEEQTQGHKEVFKCKSGFHINSVSSRGICSIGEYRRREQSCKRWLLTRQTHRSTKQNRIKYSCFLVKLCLWSLKQGFIWMNYNSSVSLQKEPRPPSSITTTHTTCMSVCFNKVIYSFK